MTQNLLRLKQIEDKIRDEKEKGRNIYRVEPQDEPLPFYFNTGCALYTDGVTTIEVANNDISLVKWGNNTGTSAVLQSAKLDQVFEATS